MELHPIDLYKFNYTECKLAMQFFSYHYQHVTTGRNGCNQENDLWDNNLVKAGFAVETTISKMRMHDKGSRRGNGTLRNEGKTRKKVKITINNLMVVNVCIYGKITQDEKTDSCVTNSFCRMSISVLQALLFFVRIPPSLLLSLSSSSICST